MLQQYVPIVKSTSAELKGLRELSDNVKDSITPVFELTRSRKTKSHAEGDVNRQLQHVASAFPDRPLILDLTGHPKHRNHQIKALQASADGYGAWAVFLRTAKSSFPGLVPTIQINDEDVDTPDEFYGRLRRQVRTLSGEFETMVYRLPVGYDGIAEDLGEVKKETSLDRIIAIVDAGFVPQNKAAVYAASAVDTVTSLTAEGVKTIVVAGSSFPSNPTQYGDDDKGEFNLEEVLMYRKVQRKVKQRLVYGDYATIHPEPSLQAGGRGWVPRMDLPCETLMLYRRSRKEKTERTYAKAYIRVGHRIVRLPEFATVSSITDTCWGIEQIQLAADGHPPALSPSFWISSRVNTHMSVRVATM